MIALILHAIRKRLKAFLIFLIIITIAYGVRSNWLPFIITNLPQTQKEVTITLDESFYNQGENINITVTNNLKSPIYYAQKVNCGSSFWSLETCTGREILYYQACSWLTFQHQFIQLNHQEIFSENWNGTVFDINHQFINADPGCYRIAFPYSLKAKQPIGESWGNDKLVSYSKSFIIK